MKRTNSYLLFAAATLLVSSATAFAEAKKSTVAAERQCADLIKECFAYSGTERSDCFHAAGTHSFCSRSTLGNLAMKRWSMSPVQNPSLDSSPALLGPKVVDGDCIYNFDNNLSGALVKGDYSAEAIKKFSATLDTCNREMPTDFMRP
jgi:hypothetical protein